MTVRHNQGKIGNMQYLVCEISGRQYLVKPGQSFKVDKLSPQERFTCDKVLLEVNDDKINVGRPYLDQKAEFEVLGDVKQTKIRVAKFKAKSNYRKVTGMRAVKTEIRLVPEKSAVKSK